MREMNLVFEVVDRLEISRESIQVPLLPAGSGGVTRLANGRLEIVLPADRPLEEFLPTLESELRRSMAP
jgi:hypothetical protein